MLYFTLGFNYKEAPFEISTSPESPVSHFQQTILYLKDEFPIFQNEVITGKFKNIRSPKQPRNLIFNLEYSLDGKLSQINESDTYILK